MRAITVLALAAAMGPIAHAQNVPPSPPASGPLHRTPHERKRDVREDIEALEKQFEQAQLAGDAVAMDKLLSDDYLGISSNGEVSTKTQQLDHIRNRTLVITSFSASDVKIKVVGQVAIVTSLAHLEGSLDGTPLHGNFRYTRVYQRLPSGAWKVTSFEATRSKNVPPQG